ncbi:protein of unknown function [Trichlorobacter ammonificans]|uniref:Uncharacterized protein n=1 Tax=Trichlorobacter ammonificans TaxID=2916410 RepID=A0ABM9D5D7_9BACT|nr:protein of unknown function [Trichlorobacter ammonificans]
MKHGDAEQRRKPNIRDNGTRITRMRRIGSDFKTFFWCEVSGQSAQIRPFPRAFMAFFRVFRCPVLQK